MADTALYDAILARRSVRRYQPESLDSVTQAQVREIIAQTRPLLPANQFAVLQRDVTDREELMAALGAYGRIVSPPHYLVPYLLGDEFPLTDLGYRVEQIAVRLTALGIGTCYIGCLGREEAVRRRFALPPEARIGAFLIYGRPSEAFLDRTVNRIMYVSAGAHNKLPIERILSIGQWGTVASPPADLVPLAQAARHAPSAVNAQPWRLLWRDGKLYLALTRWNPKYAMFQEYALYDGGICMGNISLTLEALGRKGEWRMLEEDQADLPPHPQSLRPLAALELA